MADDDESPTLTTKWRAEKIFEYLKTLIQESSEWSRDAARAFHQAMITLAAGAVVASVAFAKDLATPPRHDVGFLIASWVFFAISLLAVLMAFQQFGRERETAERRIHVWVYNVCFQVAPEDTPEVMFGPPYPPDQPKISRWLLRVSVGAFAAGVAAVIYFAAANLA